MKPIATDSFYREAQKYWKTVVHERNRFDTEALRQQIETYRRLFNIFQVGEYYFLLFDILNGEIADISPEVKTVLGYDMAEMDMHRFMDCIHPEDMPFFLTFERHVTGFFSTISPDKISYYKVQYDLRIKKKDNIYARMLIQYVPADYVGHSVYHSFHLHTDITHIKRKGTPHCSIIGLEGEPSYYDIQDIAIVTPSKGLFTLREREILKNIIEGMSSNDIAEKLCVSIHTVNTHRKNILEKSGAKSPFHLVKRAIEEGWV